MLIDARQLSRHSYMKHYNDGFSSSWHITLNNCFHRDNNCQIFRLIYTQLKENYTPKYIIITIIIIVGHDGGKKKKEICMIKKKQNRKIYSSTKMNHRGKDRARTRRMCNVIEGKYKKKRKTVLNYQNIMVRESFSYFCTNFFLYLALQNSRQLHPSLTH